MVLCNMSDSQWQQMSIGLNSAISSQDIVNKVSACVLVCVYVCSKVNVRGCMYTRNKVSVCVRVCAQN